MNRVLENSMIYTLLIGVLSMLVQLGLKNHRHGRKTNANVLFGMAYAVYIVFALIRRIDAEYGGIDAYVYMLDFQAINSGLFEYVSNSIFEFGYSVVAWLCKMLTSEFRVLLFVLHTVQYWMLISFAKSIEYWTYLSMFVFLLQLVLSFCLLRNCVSVAIALYAYMFFAKGAYKKSVIFFLIALSFHSSALVMVLPCFFAVLMRSKKTSLEGRISKKDCSSLKMLMIFVGISIGVLVAYSVAYNYLLTTKYRVYLGQNSSIGIAVLGFSLVVFLAVSSLKKDRLVLLSDQMNLYCYYALPTIPVVAICQTIIPIVYRMFDFITPLSYALVANFSVMSKQKKGFIGMHDIYKLFFNTYFIYRIVDFCISSIASYGLYYTI